MNPPSRVPPLVIGRKLVGMAPPASFTCAALRLPEERLRLRVPGGSDLGAAGRWRAGWWPRDAAAGAPGRRVRGAAAGGDPPDGPADQPRGEPAGGRDAVDRDVRIDGAALSHRGRAGASARSARHARVVDVPGHSPGGSDRGSNRGAIEEARAIVLRLGCMRFGPPDTRTTAAIKAIAELDRIEQLSERLLDVSTWQELLATP